MSVSRETKQRLDIYAQLLEKWNPKINLVAKSTLQHMWERHFEDSLQLSRLIPAHTEKLLDIGSGGGFPGLVIAIAAIESGNPQFTTLMESDQRKCAFLRTVLRETAAQGKVVTERIETAEPQKADVITARALADLSQLLAFSKRHLKPEGTALFLKGRNWRKELEEAEQRWNFEWNALESSTEEGAVLLEIKGISRD